ncbi:amino acid adenylation domain-containing protein [Niallia taxi]|uniref:non-ribosomal peptide synthetase n=1 Tax=Niallia taxi TaxID=2499688 RepID=UPI00203C8696|nr:amino acid adenylation domain-containing protein [Niallia taxi]MCM3216686.1 amino acid adenylation domain-containing protein [Niallia taxi]
MHTKIEKNNVERILELTPMQKGMLYHYLQDNESEQYFEQVSLNITGNIDFSIFKKTWEAVTFSNEILRSVFRWEKLSKPLCVILKDLVVPIIQYDFTQFDKEISLAKLEKLKQQDRKNKIDISSEPFRIHLIKINSNEFEVIMSHHHILFDGWSSGIILQEFIEFYNSLSENKEISLNKKGKFSEFIEVCNKVDESLAQSYWKSYLKGFESATELPTYRRNKVKTSINKIASLNRLLPIELESKLRTFTRTNKFTIATVMYTAWSMLLHKYSSSKDILFGTTVSGRNVDIENIENTVGLFINTLPLRVKISGKETIENILMDINQMLLDREVYSHTPLYEIKNHSEIIGNEDIFNSIVVIDNYPLNLSYDGNVKSSLKINNYSNFEMTNYDLTFSVEDFNQIKTNFIYDVHSFDPQIINNMSIHFNTILDNIIDYKSKMIDEVDIISKEEKIEIVNKFNNTQSYSSIEKTVKQLFEEQVDSHKEKTAIVFEDKELSYKELNEKSNQLAHYLRTKGVKTNDIVGLLVNPSVEMIVGILGIIKAGAAYLPLDPKSPVDRLVNILEDSKSQLLITESKLLSEFNSELNPKMHKICMDINEQIHIQKTVNLEEKNQPDDLIYTMYTSGSTGKPKGTLTSHRNVIRTVKDTNYIEITHNDILLQLSNYTFDGSAFDIFGSLLNGAKLVLVDKETSFNIVKLANLIEKEEITVFFITTVLFNTLVEFNVNCLRNIKKVLTGGERVSYNHMEKALTTLGKDKILHVYGPTENTIFTTFYKVDYMDENLKTVPIGKPISNTSVFILNNNQQIVPVGVPGDIYVSGVGLIKGYLNRPDLTNESFIEAKNLFNDNDISIFDSSNIVYKTGDYGRWLPNGNVEFLDRVDKQVKLRGFRIELGEIEKELLSFQRVENAFVTTVISDNGDKKLCAYLITKDAIDEEELNNDLQKRIPYYMMPQSYVTLENFPLNKNGKIDVNALPEPQFYDFRVEFEAPKNEIERKLQDIWHNVLEREKIGVNDSFYTLGGHSIKATMIASNVYKEFGVQIPLGELFKLPTIRLLADYISKDKNNGILVPANIKRVKRHTFKAN